MRRSGIKRSNELKRRARPTSTQKRKGRIVASAAAYRELVWRVCFGESCACGCGRRADTVHHLVPKSWQGDDLIDNLVPLAGDGTRLCHGAFTVKGRTYDPDRREYIEPAAVAAGIRAFLERVENRPKLRYVIRKTSEPWLDTHYPRGQEAAA